MIILLKMSVIEQFLPEENVPTHSPTKMSVLASTLQRLGSAYPFVLVYILLCTSITLQAINHAASNSSLITQNSTCQNSTKKSNYAVSFSHGHVRFSKTSECSFLKFYYPQLRDYVGFSAYQQRVLRQELTDCFSNYTCSASLLMSSACTSTIKYECNYSSEIPFVNLCKSRGSSSNVLGLQIMDAKFTCREFLVFFYALRILAC